MPRKYDKKRLNEMLNKQETALVDKVEIVFKNMPDCDIKGAMEPRLYKDMKKVALLTRLLPKSLLKLEMNAASIKKLRKMFNNVDSTPIIDKGVDVITDSFLAADGGEIPIYCFKSQETLENAPILYFIHGGGFFAGSTAVVADMLKLLVANTGILAFSLDYRLAPEHPYPTSHEDCYSGLLWLHQQASQFGGDPDQIFVGGDSAGGNLTLYCANRSLEDQLDLIKGQLILYPTVNMGGVQDEYVRVTKDKFDIYDKQAKVINLSLNMLRGLGDGLGQILGTTDLMTPYLTPYMAVNPKLPPTFIAVGEHDFFENRDLSIRP